MNCSPWYELSYSCQVSSVKSVLKIKRTKSRRNFCTSGFGNWYAYSFMRQLFDTCI